jgi:hypothetical protein
VTHDPGIAKAMFAHVFGPNGPWRPLLEEGHFPEGWVAEYQRLLNVARDEWHTEALWPRELVAAIHVTSFYLNIRYDAWRAFGGGRRNWETERDLAALRTPSELFLLQWIPLEPDSESEAE